MLVSYWLSFVRWEKVTFLDIFTGNLFSLLTVQLYSCFFSLKGAIES